MNPLNYSAAKPITVINTTTLAQDAFNLYHTVIADVTERIKGDLKELGKSESEVNSIAKLLSTRWKRALDESNCIDHENLIGIGLNDIAHNIGQQHQSKRRRITWSEEGGEFIEPSLPAGGNSLISGKGIPNTSEVQNPYMLTEDFNEAPALSTELSIPAPPLSTELSIPITPLIKRDEDHFGIKAEPDVNIMKDSGSLFGTALHEHEMDPESLRKSCEKPLGSDDDDSDEDGEEPTDLVVCAYSKVIKKKGDWNMDLKNGLIHFAGKDYAFQTAKGGHLKW